MMPKSSTSEDFLKNANSNCKYIRCLGSRYLKIYFDLMLDVKVLLGIFITVITL